MWARRQEYALDISEPALARTAKNRPTIRELLERYGQTISVKKRGASQERYVIQALNRTFFADYPVDKVSGGDLARHRDERLKTVKPGTVRRELALLRHCLEIARREWGIPIGRNPFLDIKLPSPGEGRDRRLEKHELELVRNGLRYCRAWYLPPLVELAIETGMRRGELLELQWSHIDLERRIAFLPMTKNGRSRKVPLTVQAVQILTGLRPRRKGRVFPVNSCAARQSWDRLMKRCGISDLRFHDLRHEAISRFFERGLSVPEVAVISGHRSYTMLFRYTHIRAEDIVRKLN